MMSTHLALPRIGHLDHMYHVFGFLKGNPKLNLAFDSAHPQISENMFQKHDCQDFYRNKKEAIPDNMLEARGNGISTHCFVDADLEGNTVTRRSQTGILIFCNRAPIMWHSKRKNTVKTSSFGSEFTAMNNAVELTEGLQYKLCMFGVPLEGPTNIFCDNEAVYKNSSILESVLLKKHHSISYHRYRKAVAAGTVRISKEGTRTNLSDLFTKILYIVRGEDFLEKFNI